METYPRGAAQQLKDGRFKYSIALYYPEGGRDRVIEQMDTIGLLRENRHTATVYRGDGFELRVEKDPGSIRIHDNLRKGPIALLLTQKHSIIYDILRGTNDSPSDV